MVRKLLCGFALTILFVTNAFSDDIIFSQPPTVSPVHIWQISSFRTAASFTLTSASLLNAIEFWAVGNPNLPASFSGTLSWAVYGDSFGLPGTNALFSGKTSSATVVDTGVQNFFGDRYDLTFNLAAPIALAANTKYWLEIHEGPTLTTNDGTEILWVSGIAKTFVEETVNGSAWSPTIDGADLAFQLHGQNAPALLPQFTFGGGWYTALYFVNTGTSAVSFPVSFTADNGTPLIVPSVGGSSTTVSIGPLGAAIIEAPNSGPLNQGYVSAALPGGVTGYGVFRQSVPGIADQEAVVPLSGASSTTSTLIWDDTDFTTTVAIVNPSSVATAVTIFIRDNSGAIIGATTVPLAAKTKTEVVLRNLPGLAAMAGQRGSADFTVASGSVAVLGLRFGNAAFTSIPTKDR
jgi:hypothetical protein